MEESGNNNKKEEEEKQEEEDEGEINTLMNMDSKFLTKYQQIEVYNT